VVTVKKRTSTKKRNARTFRGLYAAGGFGAAISVSACTISSSDVNAFALAASCAMET
jgi:hypothetical protein